MKNQIMYDIDGNEIFFVQKLKKGFMGIPLCGEDDTTIVPDKEPTFYSNLYHNPPIEKLEKDINSLKEQVEALKEQLKIYGDYIKLKEDENL